MTFDERQPLYEENLWWKTTFDERWPKFFLSKISFGYKIYLGKNLFQTKTIFRPQNFFLKKKSFLDPRFFFTKNLFWAQNFYWTKKILNTICGPKFSRTQHLILAHNCLRPKILFFIYMHPFKRARQYLKGW